MQNGAYIDAGIAREGYYAPEGSSEEIKCPEGHWTGVEGSSECQTCGAGYFCDQLGTTQAGRPACEKGHYCPSYDYFVTESATTGVMDYRQIPCEPGTYNPNTASTTINDCVPCPATKACERKALWDTTTMPLCAAGYFCELGAKSRYPDGVGTSLSGPCPAGHYCPEGTQTPTPCASGTFSNQLKATDATFCLPCPPGYLCTGTGNTAPIKNCDAGTYCSDGLTQNNCGATQTGVYCPLGSHFELYCPMGYYQTNAARGYCFECPAGSFCMNGVSKPCNEGYYCP